MKSQFLRINEYDILRWLVVAIMSATLTALYNFFSTWIVVWKEQLTACALAWITAGLWYLIKNVFTNSDWKILTTENQQI